MKLVYVRRLLIALAIVSAGTFLNSTARAVTRTWNKAAGGTFSFTDVANWDDGTTNFPNGVGDIAVMDTLDITGTQSITLDAPITLGELHFGDTVGGTTGQNFNHATAGDAGALVFQTTSGNAKITYGNIAHTQRTSTINVPVTLNSDTELTVDLASSTSRNLYFNTGALTGSGNLILGAPTRGIVAFFTDTYDFSAYTGTIKFTEYVAAGSGNGLQFAGNNLGTGNFHQATLEMSDLSGGTGYGVFIFDAQDGATLELGALRGNGLLRPFTNFNVVYLSGTLKTGYLPGTNDYSGVISPIARFPADATPATFNYEKVGANSTQIFSGANTYTGTTTVSAGTLLVNGTHTGGSTYMVASGATLGGTGGIGTSSLTVDAGGILAPGASIESFDVGDASINGTLAVQYQGTSIDLLNSTGFLDITNATVNFSSLGSLTTGAHVFATYVSLGGTAFATVSNLPTGFNIDYNYLSGNQIALVGTAPPVLGDYNGNGVVDGADYVVWRKNPGAFGGNPAGYNTWRANFGNPPGAGAGLGAASAVPEPAALLLMVTAIVGTFASRWRR